MDSLAAEEAGGPIAFTYADPSHNFLQKLIIRTIEGLTGQPGLRRLYLDYQREERPNTEFFDAAIDKLELDVVFDQTMLDEIPREGPLVVVANHPFGVVDGLMICWLTQKVRKDFRILTNAVLCQAPELVDVVLPIDFTGTDEALEVNLRSRREAREHLRAGGSIVVFPGGTVSNKERFFGSAAAVDPDWQPFTSHLIRTSRASVAPMFFVGQNSALFQFISHFSPTLRLGLLFNEVRRLRRRSLRVEIGQIIPFEELSQLGSRVELANHLRSVTYALGCR